MEQLLFINDQYEFIKEKFPCIYEEKREAILLSNKKIPVFVKVVMPLLTDYTEYKRLVNDDSWMKQVVLLCKPCFWAINTKFMEQAA